MNNSERCAKGLKWTAAALLAALVAGCGGGGGKDPILGTGVIDPLAAPTVTTVTPGINATAVPVTTKAVTATFSKAMAPATLTTASFTLACVAPAGTTPVAITGGGPVTYLAASNVATLPLPAASNLPFNAVCTATVTTAAKDTMGLALASNFVWAFTTAPDTTRPRVILSVPATTTSGPTPNVPVNTAIRVTFSEDMAAATINATSFKLTDGTTAVTAAAIPVTYASRIATFHPAAPLLAGVTYTATVTTAATDLAGNALAGNQAALPAASNYEWTFTTVADITPPTVSLVNPADLDTGACLQKTVSATFSEAMNPATLNSSPAGTLPTFTLKPTVAGIDISGTVAMNATNKVATFTPTGALLGNTSYTATITTFAKDLAGNPLAVNKVWSFTTGTLPCGTLVPVSPIDLGAVARFGTFGGTAGATNTGNQTVITGSGGNTADIGTIATDNSAVTGFHDSAPSDIYTEVPGVNVGNVTGKIYTCTTSTTGPTVAAVNAVSCSIATQALLDAREAYLALAGMPVSGVAAAGNLAGLTLAPGVYKAPSGSFLIEGGNLTLDAQGDASAVFVFQMATTLTVGGPGAAAPQSVILINGAQAKNVFWQVGSAAIINAAGGGTMVGTIISEAGAAFSTAGNVNPVTLNGRAVSLGASVTMVNTIINVPAP